MALYSTATLLPNSLPRYAAFPTTLQSVIIQADIDWASLVWTAFGIGAVLWLSSEVDRPDPKPCCGICGRTGHNRQGCPQNPEKRVALRIEKTGRCSCCKRRSKRTEAHHYAGPADGTKGREMCGNCHLNCGHGGHWQNMAINPRYCRVAT